MENLSSGGDCVWQIADPLGNEGVRSGSGGGIRDFCPVGGPPPVNLANKCPLIDGNVVYQARVLLRRLSQNIMVYNDNCLGGDHGIGGDQRLAKANIEDQQYSLTPNPNDGIMQLRQAFSDLNPVRIKVYNVLGALVYSAVRSFEGNITTLDLSRETPGFYHVSLQDSRGGSYSLRFVKK